MTAEDGDDAATETETTGNDMTAEDGSGEVAGTPEIAPAGGPDYVSYTVEDYGSGPCAPAAGVAEPVLHFDSAPMLCIDTSVPHTATFDTSRGVVRVALDVANTPGTVNSFVNLARFGYYDDTLVHRSAPSIGILQGGSPHTNTAADPGPGYTLWDEGTGFTYRPGQLVMARRNEPNSAGAQYFFTVTDDAGLLDGQGTYVVFGEVIEGLDVLSDILASHVDEPDNPLGGAPDPPVVVDSVTIEAG
ncbi:MAG: peptidylprolyl isomerase [Acidimicrobiia bacterium]|nr:peptidylprolyl isomerase [Acidimicrobiia bacterium]